MKHIYIVSEFSEGALNVSEKTILFKNVASIISHALDISSERIGEEDIEVRNHELELVRTAFQDAVEENIRQLQKDKDANTKVTFMNKALHLNIFNDQHRLLDSLIRIYNIIDGEVMTRGCFYLFNLTPVDNADAYILITLKTYGQRETINFFYTYYKSKYEQYKGMPYEEFEARVDKLTSNKFITIESDQHEIKYLVASIKTKKINF